MILIRAWKKYARGRLIIWQESKFVSAAREKKHRRTLLLPSLSVHYGIAQCMFLESFIVSFLFL